MPKIRGDVRRRMREAALALFSEKGYERTTAAEIAARAGVTERTFFRHFPDKREVLFNEAELHARLDAAIAEAPPALNALEIVVWAFKSAAPLFEENLPLANVGQAVIAQTPALQERQLAKTALITRAIAKALKRRDIAPAIADLAAATGMALTGHALRTCVQDPSTPLVKHLENAFQTLQVLSSTEAHRTKKN
ncbi:transcriptional regulator, TetR family [Pseudoxanthomonas sp. GM95]|uniref:TetR/AcrR family transcriptional regulator n=1 Tax=Pseudoxanthomonas sp. GM95 TaxID=1881043 RepID=UPI0008B785EF|nr:TetR/AcrR family transcriptional regulator [Pseudoxanthomonas sp. GM95]SEM52137.1 transcriptional regulator, TetR family [Pseudoxanthomonas sp. GM95]